VVFAIMFAAVIGFAVVVRAAFGRRAGSQTHAHQRGEHDQRTNNLTHAFSPFRASHIESRRVGDCMTIFVPEATGGTLASGGIANTTLPGSHKHQRGAEAGWPHHAPRCLPLIVGPGGPRKAAAA